MEYEIASAVVDGVTPIGAYAALARELGGPSFLLESAPAPQATARYSIMGFGSVAQVRVSDARAAGATRPLAALRDMLARERPDARTLARMPFLGAYGAVAFEFAGCLERLPSIARGTDPMPDLHFIVPRHLVVFDHFTHVATAASTCGEDLRAEGVLLRVGAATIASLPPARPAEASLDGAALPYERAVLAAQEAIFAGEAFQIVLSRGWAVRSESQPLDAYRRLRSINPSPYMFFLDLGWGALLGSSPEVLVRVDGRRATVRPLAGTRPRPLDSDEDRRTARGLLRDPKERAEHVMLVDLGRNDVGRVAVAGSVRVRDFMQVERFSHVMHIVSTVQGTLAEEHDALDALAAAFPAGTVSGAPKIRALEIIAELEGVRRGFYAGAVGYAGFNGALDACITLRSLHAYDGVYHLRAGAGIVADSDPASEARECAAKAGAPARALGVEALPA